MQLVFLTKRTKLKEQYDVVMNSLMTNLWLGELYLRLDIPSMVGNHSDDVSEWSGPDVCTGEI